MTIKITWSQIAAGAAIMFLAYKGKVKVASK